MTDLDKLIESVEGGVGVSSALLPIGREYLWGNFYLAYQGSLDAAKALHDALLPSTSQYQITTDPTCIRALVRAWPNGLRDIDCVIDGDGWDEFCPARAWLIAVLKAYRAQVQE